MVELITDENKKEIFYNIVNSLLAGLLVFLGSLTNGFSWAGVGVAFISAGIVAITKFKEYWASEAEEYKSTALFSFL